MESEIMVASNRFIAFLVFWKIRNFLKTENGGHYTIKGKTAQAKMFVKVQRNYHQYCNGKMEMT